MELVNYEDNEGMEPFTRILEEINREFVKFVFCSHRHFVYLQRNFTDVGSGEMYGTQGKRAIYDSSSMFREHLVTLKDELIYLYEDAEQEENQNPCQEQCLEHLVDTLGMSENTQTLWHFLEFMVLLPSYGTWLQTTDWLRGMLCSEHPLSLQEVLTRCSSTDCPEFLAMDEGRGENGEYFWNNVYWLLSLGRISDAWAVLKLHSEVADALSQPPSRHSPASQLESIFLSHPSVLFPIIECDQDLLDDASFLMQQVAAWRAWTGSVRQLLADNSALIVGIPPLLHLLKFFVGCVENLQLKEGEGPDEDSWQVKALHRLLYSPHEGSHERLSRQDVGQLLQDAIARDHNRESSSGTVGVQMQYTDVVSSLLKQELGGFLTYCATAPVWVGEEGEGATVLRDLSTGISLVNTMHVAALLQLSGGLAGAGTTQGAFVVKTAVAGSTQLSRMEFPHEVS